jgi:hypothetical protein
MLTVEEIKGIIEQAEKQKQELQELIDSLSTMEVEPEGRRRNGERYFIVEADGNIESASETGHEFDTTMHEIGNYYLTETDAIRAEKQIRLFRLLDRFSRQNGWTDETWKDRETCKYCIYFDHVYKQIKICDKFYSAEASGVYFVSESVAQQAIEKYHDLIMEVMAI